MVPVLNADGVILNAAVLRDSQVLGQRVRCPACASKGFARWPGGWNERNRAG